MLHLIKLSVGPRDVAQLRDWQSERAVTHPPLRHRTRSRPKRAEEIVAGGSIFWVVAGFLAVRQRVLDIREDCMEDGSACAAIVLDPTLVPVAVRPVKPFQGWRYLEADAAPPDLGERPDAEGLDALPAALRQELHALGLI